MQNRRESAWNRLRVGRIGRFYTVQPVFSVKTRKPSKSGQNRIGLVRSRSGSTDSDLDWPILPSMVSFLAYPNLFGNKGFEEEEEEEEEDKEMISVYCTKS